ncbi:hypothetical protein PBAL39_25605 [Pedobacter sp. BAL39]|uniref:SusC/RagA family TonB-linked outer membrane protein n=1 Tax=Pedobacter sp. BAL39 TaxID=391596 RepID=UPI0001559728|nr:SusC/RagA family TonB-linked outer membrane protein [Pedobacter sp. BAL39]EDM36707.1 hypothetical protein PBAL39_25605 [Pedobacter sp. BAL39]
MNKRYLRYISRVCILILLIVGIQNSYAQTEAPDRVRIQLDFRNTAVSTVIKEIEKQSSYHFNYDEGEVDLSQKITLHSTATLKQVLYEISTRSNLGFNISGNTIAIRRNDKKDIPGTRMISGLVTDAKTGSPIPGVNIYKKGTAQGAVTNAKGEFTFKLTGPQIAENILVFKYIGMKTRELKAGNSSHFPVTMEDEVLGMNEVVVTGSYTKDKRREDVVGSISQLSAAQLQTQRPIESFDKMLEGMVSGVYVETTTELNTPVTINIRGQGSLPSFGVSRSTSSQPLYVIDGIPSYEQQRGNEAQEFSGERYLNPLSNINPNDIKSISILKDATASALYGANAANGVIIITTKSGDPGTTKLDLSYDTGIATFINEYKWLNGPQYYSLLREAYINGGSSATAASQLAGSKDTNTDWSDLTTRNAVYQNAGLNISGGNENTTFRFSSGYRNQKSSGIGNDLEKIYARLRVDHKLGEKFRMAFNFSPTVTKGNSLSNYGDVWLPPNLAPYNAEGSFSDFVNVPNPLAIVSQNEDSDKGIEMMANANASYQLSKSIAISATVGADSYQNKQTKYLSPLNATGRNFNGRLTIYDRSHLGYTGFVQGTYDKTFADAHTVNFLIGTQLEDRETELLRGVGSGFTFERRRVLSAATTQSSASSTSSSATISYYSQLGYDFDKKYYANLNGRIDKSSMFGGDRQVAFNGSVGLAWIVSKENFLKDSKVLTMLKLRATYGTTGNSRIGNYSARGLYNFGTATGNSYNGNVSSFPLTNAAPNPELGWEKNKKLNFAADINLFDKVDLTAEFYSNVVDDLISSASVPLETGFANISLNTGKMRNRGFELSIASNIISKKNFSWNLSYNISGNRNKLLSFNNGYSSLYSVPTSAAGLRVGQSTSAIYGYQWAGINQETGAEQFYDSEGNIRTTTEINALQITETSVLGDRLPDFYGGLINSFDIHNFNLSFNILYSSGASKIVSYVDESDGRNLQNRNQSIDLLDRWQRNGDVTNIPQLLIVRSVVSNSSRYLYNMSYLKLSNVSLSYRLSSGIADKLRLGSASFFANATNLFYLYKDAGTKGRNGIAERRFVFPETMAITGGVRLGF